MIHNETDKRVEEVVIETVSKYGKDDSDETDITEPHKEASADIADQYESGTTVYEWIKKPEYMLVLFWYSVLSLGDMIILGMFIFWIEDIVDGDDDKGNS